MPVAVLRPSNFVEKAGLSPGKAVRQQTRDVIQMLNAVRPSCTYARNGPRLAERFADDAPQWWCVIGAKPLERG
jgi:hypothetical protein